MYGYGRDTHRLSVERGRGRNDDTTSAVRCTLGRGGEIVGFGGGGYKESRSWCSLLVGFLSLSVASSGEEPALTLCWRGTSLSTISCIFVPIFFSGQSVVVDVEGVGFRLRADVVGKGVVAGCTRIFSSREYVYDN